MRSDSSRQSTFQELGPYLRKHASEIADHAITCFFSGGALCSPSQLHLLSSIINNNRTGDHSSLVLSRSNGYTISSKRDLGEMASTASTPKKYPDSTRRIGPVTRLCSISWHRHFPRICERTAVHRQSPHPATRYPRPAMPDLAELDRQPSLSISRHFCTWMENAWFYLMGPASLASASCHDSHAQCLGIEVGLAPLSLSCCLLFHSLHFISGVLVQDASLAVVTTTAVAGNSELGACNTLGH